MKHLDNAKLREQFERLSSEERTDLRKGLWMGRRTRTMAYPGSIDPRDYGPEGYREPPRELTGTLAGTVDIYDTLVGITEFHGDLSGSAPTITLTLVGISDTDSLHYDDSTDAFSSVTL